MLNCRTPHAAVFDETHENPSKYRMASPLLTESRPTSCVSERRQAEAMTWCGFSHQYFRTTLCLLEKLLGLPFNARTYCLLGRTLAGLSFFACANGRVSFQGEMIYLRVDNVRKINP